MRRILLIASLFVGACTFDPSGRPMPAGGDDNGSAGDVDAGPGDPVTSTDAGTPDATPPPPDARDDQGPGGGHGHPHDD